MQFTTGTFDFDIGDGTYRDIVIVPNNVSSLTAYDHMLRGLHAMASSERSTFLEAREQLARAIADYLQVPLTKVSVRFDPSP